MLVDRVAFAAHQGLPDGVHSLHPLVDADDIEVTIQSTDPILDCVKDISEKTLALSQCLLCLLARGHPLHASPLQ